MPYPKVLIIGQTFNKNDGGGVTMSNLFTGWPKDKLAVASNANLSNDLDISVCDTYFQLAYNNKLHPFPLNIVLPKIKCGIVSVSKNGDAQAKKDKTLKSGKFKILYGTLLKALHFFGLYNVFYKLKITPGFSQWIKQYNPDIIYSQLASLELICFTKEIHTLIKKPVVIHMMDDWPSTISEKGLFKNFWNKKIDQQLRLLLDKTTLLLSISDLMAQEYKERYGKNSVTFHNPIEIDFWKASQKQNYKLNEIPVILYAGRIGTGVKTCLETMASAIDQVNNSSNENIQFVLQTKDRPSWIENYKCIKYKSPVAYSELPKIFADADFLYLPYDFSTESIKFIKYSMPTKAPEYMASGTPIIIFAPANTAIVKDAQVGNWAKVIVQNDINVLSEAIKSLINDKMLRRQIGANAVSIAEAKYNANIIRNQFKQIVTSAVN